MLTIKDGGSQSMSSLVGGMQVVHAIPGRIRLRMPALRDRQRTNQLTDRLLADPAIINFRINPACASIAIRYRPQKIAAISAPEYFLRYWEYQLTSGKAKDAGDRLDAASTTSELADDSEAEADWSSLGLPIAATLLAVASQSWPHPLVKAVAGGVFAACILPVVQRAGNSVLVDRQLNIDCLDLMAIALGTIQGKLITPALMMTLHGIGDVLREQTARSTAIQTADLLDTIGHFAWVVRDNKIIKIKSDLVQVGEIVQVYPGNKFPWMAPSKREKRPSTNKNSPGNRCQLWPVLALMSMLLLWCDRAS